jgi:hypothetical protein
MDKTFTNGRRELTNPLEGKMDEDLKVLLESILFELKEINDGIKAITENKIYDLHDVCNRLQDVDSSISQLNK